MRVLYSKFISVKKLHYRLNDKVLRNLVQRVIRLWVNLDLIKETTLFSNQLRGVRNQVQDLTSNLTHLNY